jgi:hypothetical protein
MNRSLKLERLYWLGDFRNIKVIDDIIDLPDEIVLNDTAVGLVRMMQLLQTEKVYQKYVALGGRFKEKTQEEILGIIDELESDTMNKLKEIFKNGKTEN